MRNGVDMERFADAKRSDAVRASLGAAPGDLLALYIGAHGISQGLSSLVDAAALLRSELVHIAFVGEGADKTRVTRYAEALGLENVTFASGVDRSEVPTLLASADVCLAPLRSVDLFSTFVPSKIFEYMGAGRPVIASLEGEAAGIITSAGGLAVPPDDAPKIADAILKIQGSNDMGRQLGTHAQSYAAAHYDRRQNATSLQAIRLYATAVGAGCSGGAEGVCQR